LAFVKQALKFPKLLLRITKAGLSISGCHSTQPATKHRREKQQTEISRKKTRL